MHLDDHVYMRPYVCVMLGFVPAVQCIYVVSYTCIIALFPGVLARVEREGRLLQVRYNGPIGVALRLAVWLTVLSLFLSYSVC